MINVKCNLSKEIAAAFAKFFIQFFCTSFTEIVRIFAEKNWKIIVPLLQEDCFKPKKFLDLILFHSIKMEFIS